MYGDYPKEDMEAVFGKGELGTVPEELQGKMGSGVKTFGIKKDSQSLIEKKKPKVEKSQSFRP